jgi:hypothetical protein
MKDAPMFPGVVVKLIERENLATYVELISDDFGSTFVVVDDNTLANMLGLPSDFEKLNKIIHNYIPNANIEYVKSGKLDGDYDIYFIKDIGE